MIRVTIFNEFYKERNQEAARAVYPEGIHAALADMLRCEEIDVKTSTQDEECCGLTEDVLEQTDVLIWWGHVRHKHVPDEVAYRVQQAVLQGMGAIFLHSAHHSKPFKLLMGTCCHLSWREDGDLERLWTIDPAHPIARGIGRYVEIPHEETYCEPFYVPEPDQLVFLGWYEGGEVIRAGCCYRRGHGKVFYFQPGHETYPVYYLPQVKTILQNAVKWARPEFRVEALSAPHVMKIGQNA